MTQITNDHVEWAVVSRLRRMLEEPPHQKFNVTQAYALFTTILCWVLQHTRIPSHEIKSDNDKIAHRLWENFSDRAIADDPWCVYVKPIERIELVGNKSIRVPPPRNFEEHTVDRFLINLRDATAHGDARKVQPFNFPISSEQLLVGFHFACAEYKDSKHRSRKTWEGEITLLEGDFRRIGVQLAKIYCDALRHDERHRRDGNFGADAASVKEAAA